MRSNQTRTTPLISLIKALLVESRFVKIFLTTCLSLMLCASGVRAAELARPSAPQGGEDIVKGRRGASELFTGVWSDVDVSCDHGQPDRCGGFVLYLIQNGNRLCGDHFFSTMGAGRLNEGAPKSVIGRIVGTTAMVSITSGRDSSIFHAKIRRVDNVLHWQRLKQVKMGEMDEPLIPERAQLSKTTSADDIKNLSRVAAECKEQ